MDKISFTIPVVPVPKARHRSARLPNGRIIAYNDSKARGDIETFIAYARPYSPKEPYGGAVSLKLTAFLTIAQSWSKKKKEAAYLGVLCHTKKPDLDNYLKFACDCMNGLFWVDDSQVVTASVTKRYGDVPRWEIEVEAI